MSNVLSLQQHAAPKQRPDGAALLSEVECFIRRFCSLPIEADYVAATLWAAHTHMIQHFHTTPRLALLSPEAGSGKTRVLEVLNLLTPNSMFVFSASTAAIFRTMEKKQTTLLFDEVDTIFGRYGKGDHNEDLRALLNAGYRDSATIPRCVGKDHQVQHFRVFAPVALAGLGNLPDTVMTRSVVIRMRRRSPTEHIEPFRLREHEGEGHVLRDRLAAWAETVGAQVGDAWPAFPVGIVDRPAEVWEPLLAIGDAAGGDWSERARASCATICGSRGGREQSLGVRLLVDLRCIFGDAGALYTSTILDRLRGNTPYMMDDDGQPVILTDAPWGDLRGSPIDSRRLSNLLKQYDVEPVKLREGGTGKSLQGYRRAALCDAWERYAPVLQSPEHAEQVEQVGQVDAVHNAECSGCSACSGSAGNEEGEVSEIEL